MIEMFLAPPDIHVCFVDRPCKPMAFRVVGGKYVPCDYEEDSLREGDENFRLPLPVEGILAFAEHFQVPLKDIKVVFHEGTGTLGLRVY